MLYPDAQGKCILVSLTWRWKWLVLGSVSATDQKRRSSRSPVTSGLPQ
jgi:hypothetical protein